MKTTVSILLTFLLLFHFSAQLGLIAWYSLNKAYVAQNLCENRDKPESCCKGKCYIGKQLGGLERDQTQTANISEKDMEWYVMPDVKVPFLKHTAEYLFFSLYRVSLSDGYRITGVEPPETSAV